MANPPTSVLLQHLRHTQLSLRVTPGEYYDRLTILWIKHRNSQALAPQQREQLKLQIENMEYQFRVLGDEPYPPELEALVKELRQVNSNLWLVEDAVRALDAEAFPVENAARSVLERFGNLARQVYVLNTERHRVKAKIDAVCQRLPEVKHYTQFKESA